MEVLFHPWLPCPRLKGPRTSRMYSLELSPSSHSVHSADAYQRPSMCQEHHSVLGRSAAIPVSALSLSSCPRAGFHARSQGCAVAWGAAGPASAPALKGQPFSQVPCDPAVWATAQPVEYFFILQAVFFSTSGSVREEEVCVSMSL